MNRDFKGVWIPKEIWEAEDLKLTEKVLLADVYIEEDKPICKVYEYGEMVGVSKHRLSVLKRNLTKKGYIKKVDYTYKELKEAVLKYKGIKKKCEWCGKESIVLNEHHYPIPRREGGTEVVNICPNCHYAFHFLENGRVLNGES